MNSGERNKSASPDSKRSPISSRHRSPTPKGLRGRASSPSPRKSPSVSPRKEPAGRVDATKSTNHEPLPWKSISFACGGWLQFYLYGVARAMQARGLDSPDVTYCGCSAGALAAAGLVLEGDFDAAVQFCKDVCVPKAHNHISGLFQLAEYVSQCIDMQLIDTKLWKEIPAGKLQISATSLPFFGAKRFVAYENIYELKQCLLASAAAFPVASLGKVGDCWYMDGGVSDFQPIVDSETITVSPFYFSDCDIKPSRYLPLWWALIPPKNIDTVEWIYDLGFKDAMDYFDARNLPTTTRAKLHLQEIKIRNNPHPYDTPRTVSMHRFLGYDLGNLTPNYVSSTMDILLHLMLVVVWKPLALILIYIELMINIAYYLITAVVSDMREALPAIGMCLAFFAFVCSLETSSKVSPWQDYKSQPQQQQQQQQQQHHHQQQQQQYATHYYSTASVSGTDTARKIKPWNVHQWRWRWPPWGKRAPPPPEPTVMSSAKVLLGHVLYYISMLYNESLSFTTGTLGLKSRGSFLLGVLACVLLPLLAKNVLSGRSKRSRASCSEILTCLSCIWSISLLGRFLSGRPSSVQLRKHEKLYKVSILYRVFRHFI